MSQVNPVLHVFRKEAMEMLRDKRVRSGAFVMPLFIVMMMMMMFGYLAEKVGKAENITIDVVKTSDPLVAQLKGAKLNVNQLATEDEGITRIKEGKAKLVVIFDAPKDFGLFKQKIIRLRFDPKEEGAMIAKGHFLEALNSTLKKQVEEEIVSRGLPKEAAEPIKFKDDPVQVGQGKGASGFIAGFLPYMIVLFAFTGGFSIASDLVAGEKEKSTLETLLISPVKRSQLVFGKFLALCLVCLMSSVSAVLGIVLSSMLHMSSFEKGSDTSMGLTPQLALVVLVLMLPLIALFAGVLLAVSTYARNMREAQTYLSLVNLIVIVPAVFSQLIGFTDFAHNFWVNTVPILNTATNIRAALQGKPELWPIVTTMATGLVIAAIALRCALWLFDREEVLLRV